MKNPQFITSTQTNQKSPACFDPTVTPDNVGQEIVMYEKNIHV